MTKFKSKWYAGYRTVLTCLACKTAIYSPRSGQFTSCKCDEIFIEETPYYCRIGGDTEEYKIEYLKMADTPKENQDAD